MYRVSLIIAILLFYQHYFSQILFDQGATSTAICGANVTQTDVWSINNNIGSLAKIESISLGVSINNRFLISDFSTGAIAFILPVKKGAFGFNYSNFGNQNYAIHSSGLGYAMRLGENFSAGIKINYLFLDLGENYGSRSIFSADIGLNTQLSSALTMGVVLKNPTLSKLSEFDDERMPTSIQIGLDYAVSDQLNTIISFEKDLLFPSSLRAAILYRPVETIILKGGVGTNPTSFGFGIGTNIKRFTIDIGSQYHQILGFSPEISISTNLHK